MSSSHGGARGIGKAICELFAAHGAKVAITDILDEEDNIRVNSIHPGFIWTQLVEDLARASSEGEKKFRENLDALHPIGHVGEPMDIAYAALYLASAEAKFVTGSELVIDGGYTAL